MNVLVQIREGRLTSRHVIRSPCVKHPSATLLLLLADLREDLLFHQMYNPDCQRRNLRQWTNLELRRCGRRQRGRRESVGVSIWTISIISKEDSSLWAAWASPFLGLGSTILGLVAWFATVVACITTRRFIA
jgi:hypothetical protein